MDRRQSARVTVQLPVQVWGIDAYGQAFTGPAMVSNLSAGGLVLHGLRRHMRVGELLDVRMERESAEFRVVWIGGPNTHRAGQLGMQRVTSEAFVPESVLIHCSQAPALC